MPTFPEGREEVKTLIRAAFADAPHPGAGPLVRSRGDEPAEVEEIFRAWRDWRSVPPELLDRAGAASPAALAFFSPAAFRFFLPAYLIADLDGSLVYTDPLFHLYFGLDRATRDRPVTIPHGGTRRWWDVQQEHLAAFTSMEGTAVVAYLRWKHRTGSLTDLERQSVEQALESFWLPRSRAGTA